VCAAQENNKNTKTFHFQYLTKKLGADPVTFGYLQTTFAVVQLAGGPLFGRFGDVFGGRAAMSLAFLAASASYCFLALSYNLPILFMSRLPSVFMHAMQG
jgi:OCT family organic cation transporter-like MFS transporter 18